MYIYIYIVFHLSCFYICCLSDKPVRGDTKGILKKPSAAVADPEDNDDDKSPTKLALAITLANGDVALATKALSLKQSERNQFTDALASSNTPNVTDLKVSWNQLQELGNGRNKKLRLSMISDFVIF